MTLAPRSEIVSRVTGRCFGVLLGALALLLFAASSAAATTWNVTNTGDALGMCPSTTRCTIRAAVAGAADGDLVMVPAGMYSLTASDPIIIDHSIAISGAGAATTTVGGGNATRIFEVGGGTTTPTVTISGLTLQHGNGAGTDDPSDGGAVLVHTSGSALTLQNDALNNNTGAFGGGIDSVGTLTVKSSTFTGNVANGAGGVGGGIYITSTGSATIGDGSTITGNTSDGDGGGIFTQGPLMLQASTVNGNTAAANGGAIGGQAPITIQSSTLSGNTAASGGGGAVSDSGTLSITASTLDHNTTGTGGGSGNGGAIANQSTLTLTNSTVSDNNANGASGFGQGGAIDVQANATLTNDTIAGNSSGAAGGTVYIEHEKATAVVTLANTIIAGGSAPSGSNCASQGTFTSEGHNVEDTSPSQCGLGAPGDQVGVNPRLGTLQGNGGPAFTQALMAGSPAIDKGLNSSCPSSDERGVARPQGPACDIGAYELAPPRATTGSATNVSITGATLTGQAANPDVQTASVFFKYGTTTAYGSQTAPQPLSASSGSTSFSAGLGGLKPGTKYHFALVVVNPDGTAVGSDQSFATRGPSLGKVKVKPSHFVPLSGSGPSIVSKGKGGAVISYTDSLAATTTFTVLKPATGYRKGGRCVAHAPKHSKHLKRCTRWVAVGSFTHLDKPGTNRFRFSGRIRHHALTLGAYRLQAIARLSGGVGNTRTTAFVIV